MEQKTAATTGKYGKWLRDLREEHGTLVREASSWDVQRVTESEELDIVEGSAPSETVEESTRMFSIRTGDVGAPATWDRSPTVQEKKMSHEKTLEAETSERKERRHTGKLFRTNSLKEGPV
jgi:hypothetical protein